MKKKILFSFLIPSLVFITAPSMSAGVYGIQEKTSHCLANQALPDPACTPGAVLTTSAKIICVSGYANIVRDVPLSERKQVFKEYGIPYALRGNYEVDHLISLELGGSNAISNLWPEPHYASSSSGSLVKDNFENYLHKQVCSGKITVQEAQYEISTNWLQYDQAKLSQKTNITIHPATPAVVPAPSPIVSTLLQPAPNTQSFTPVTAGPAQTKDQSASPTLQNSNSSIPVGATARCSDSTYSFSKTRSGTCSRHGGVMRWLY